MEVSSMGVRWELSSNCFSRRWSSPAMTMISKRRGITLRRRPNCQQMSSVARGIRRLLQSRAATHPSGRSPRACFSGPCLARSLEYQNQVIGGHRHDLAQCQFDAAGQLLDIADVAHAPFSIALAQASIEHGIADGRVLAVALERPVEEQPAVIAQMTRRALKQPFRHAPR